MDKEEESQDINEPASTEQAYPADIKSAIGFSCGTLLCFSALVGFIEMASQKGWSLDYFVLVEQETRGTASWLFTSYDFGYVTGSLCGGLLYDLFKKKRLFLALAYFILAVTTISLPWCRWFTLMLVVRFDSGLGAGALDTGANAHVKYFMVEKAGHYLIPLQYALSNVERFVPFSTEPILAERSCQYLNFTEYVGNQTHANLTFMEDMPNNTTGNECETTKFGEKIIHSAYISIAAMIIVNSVPFSVYVSEIETSEQLDKKKEVEQRTQIIMSKRARILILVLIGLFMIVNGAVDDTFTSFLTTFYPLLRLDEFHKDLCKVFFGMAFLVSRMLAITIVEMFKPINLSSLLLLAFVGVVIACLTSITILLLVSICLAGFSLPLIVPSVYSWTEENILPVTGKISSFFVIAGFVGRIINRVMLGYLMEKMTPLWFVCLLLGKSCLSLMLLFAVLKLVNFFKQSEISEVIDAENGKEMVPL